jgi:putative transposon-encoded protein
VNKKTGQPSVVLPRKFILDKKIVPKFVKLKITIPKDYIGKVGDIA